MAVDVITKHERVLVKQILHIWSESELMQGEMEESPRKGVEIPDYAGEKTRDESLQTYRMVVTDPLGEKKVSVTGELQDGRAYLCNTFKISDSPNRLVLVAHLMAVLQYEDSEDSFLSTYSGLLPLTASTEVRDILYEKGFVQNLGGDLKFVTFKSAFVQFGAALIATGTRVIDDYWEVVAKRQNLTPHHRVFKLSARLVDTLKKLKPKIFSQHSQSVNATLAVNDRVFESPYPTVTEQASAELRLQYGREFANGEHFGAVIPGQSISGSLELSALFKIPKYHNKNSFQQASQMNALDLPIGLHIQASEANSVAVGQERSPSMVQPTSKPSKRMLNSILDVGPVAKLKRQEDQGDQLGPHAVIDESLHINGWKFDQLPLKTSNVEPSQRSTRGLPFYDKNRLMVRLNKLTPNEIKEIEHSHDAVYLNLGLQNVRKIRAKKWSKYWQYKTGVPIGLMSSDVDYFKNQYVKDVLQQTSSVTNYNPETNVDETHVTIRKAKANYLGYSNIHGFKPPYVSKP